jgi:Mrp family chromosome partitioning ATPase
VPLDEAVLARNRLISAARTDPAHAAFEVLRTRLMQALAEHGWSRVAITSPTKDCGKSFVAANLALSLSRHETARTVLMDMDLRNPSLAKLFGISAPGTMSDFLSGRTSTAQHFLRFAANRLKIGGNLAMGLNHGVESFASEMLQLPATAAALARLRSEMAPDVVLFDLPPALYHDDVLAFRPEYDGVLLVVGGGITRADEIREVSRRLSDHTPLLGVVLNRAEGPTITNYSY